MAFEPRPSYNPWNRQRQIGLALDTPYSFTQALGENFGQGILDSFGLGSVTRDLMTGGNALRPSRLGVNSNPLIAPLEGAYALRDLFDPDRSKPLSKEEYEASPFFRKDIAWDQGFTEDRAASLAALYDKKKTREHFSQKQPVAAFLGQLGGQAFDPINYVPVFGPAVQAAAVAKAGSIAGRMLVSASDAAINTAAFGVLTAGIRQKYGDDVSFQAIATEIAMSAVIGGGFGGIAGGIAHARGLDKRKAAVERTRERSETLGNTMEARAALNDAVAGLVEAGEVRLNPNSLAAIEKLSDEALTASSSQKALAAETRGIAGSKAGEVVIAPSGARVNVRPELVEAASLTHASGNLQVRDRASAQSAAQVEQIATGLDPARLMPNVDGAQGAPLVGADGVIDSGNGRVMAINRAYDAYPERAEAYRQALVEAGYAEAATMERPVLVSRRLTELSPEARAQFNAELNGPTTARMSAVELAAMDRNALDEGVMDALDSAPITAASNRAFVGRFLARLPANERGALVDAAGNLSADGQRRVENALVAAAYGDADAGVLRRFAEATDDNTRAIVGALSDVAGKWAKMRHAIKRGEIAPEFDMTEELTQAVRLLGSWREQAAREGRPVSMVIREGLAQLDLLSGEISPEAQVFVRMFYQNDHFARAVGREVLSNRLEKVIEATEELGRPSLFGDTLMPTKGEVLTNAQREQADIFTADGLEPRPETLGRDGEGRATGEAGAADRPGTEGSDFKGWFGDSKVVDAEGKPLVVHHGSTVRGIKSFDPEKLNDKTRGTGFWFTEREKAGTYAGEAGEVYPVYLKMERPIVVEWDGHWTDGPAAAFVEYRVKDPRGFNMDGRGYWETRADAEAFLDRHLAQPGNEKLSREGFEIEETQLSGEKSTDEWVRKLRREHPEADGIILKNVSGGGDAAGGFADLITGDEYVVFSPEQIRMAESAKPEPMTPEQRAVEQAAHDAKASVFPPAAVARDVATVNDFIAAQPDRSLDDTYAVIGAHQEALHARAQQLASEHGATWKNPGLKKKETAAEKMARKAYTSTKRLTDLVRGGFVVGTPAQADAIVDGLRQSFDVFDEGWTMTAVNYFDRKVLVRFDDGTVGEVQFWHPEMLDAKQNKGGHQLYEAYRQFDSEHDPRAQELFRRQRELYAASLPEADPSWVPVINGLLGRSTDPGNAARNAASEIGLPESMTSAQDVGSQAAPSSLTNSALPSSVMTAGRASQLKHFMGDTSDSPVPINGTEPAPDPAPDGLAEAAARVGRGEAFKQMAETHGLAEDGSFVEQADIEQMRQAGALSPEDEAELLAAQQAYDNAEAYSDTLAVAARCVIG